MNLQRKQLAVILVLVSFLCQGMASLIYQVSWEQAMEKIVGSAVPTMAMIVSIFLSGMGLGAYLFSKIRLNYRSAGKFYAISQFFLFALGLIFAGSNGLDFLCSLSVNNINWLPFAYLIRLTLLCLYLLPTAMLVGAGFPLLLSLAGFYQLNLSARQIYLFNLVGSAIGAILTGFVLLPQLGMAKSTVIAASIHLLAGLLIIAIGRLCQLSATVDSVENPLAAQPDSYGIDSNGSKLPAQFSQAFLLLTIVAISGFFNMFLELIFIRYYSLIIGSSTWAYSLVLATMLIALGCGTLLAGQKVQSRLLISLLFLLGGTSVMFSSIILSQLPFIFAGLKLLIGFLPSCIIIFIWTMFPLCLCLGAVLPCCFNAAELKGELSSVKPGQIYAVNLLAAVIGCLIGGTVAIPFLSLFSSHAIYLSFVLSALALLVTGTIICSPIILSSKQISWTAATLSILLCLALWPIVTTKFCWNEAALTAGLNYLSPNDLKATKHWQEAVNLPILFYKEGLNSTVSVMTNPKLNVICLKTDGQMEAALPIDPNLPAPTSDQKTQIMLGVLPACFSSNPPENAFLLGYGSGITARSILRNAGVKNLTVAELEPAVIEASRSFVPYYGQIGNLNQAAPNNMQIKEMDGRCLLSLLNHRYGMIVSQPGEPSRSSCGHLFTLEFWQLAKSRLQPGGVFCQWLPLYAIDRSSLISLCRTFLCIFPNTFVIKLDRSAELILLGFNGKAMETPIGFPPDCPAPQSLSKSLAKYDQDQQTNSLNKDDFPFVQYRLQAVLARQGMSVNNDMEKMMSVFFSPTSSPVSSK